MKATSKRNEFGSRRRERGQTIIFVALAIVGLLGMAALAIDVVSLYVAKGEAQRAADAAAIAGATAFVNSGATSATDGSLNALGQSMAASFINAALAQDNVAGTPPSLVGTPTYNTTTPGNPRVTVTVQQINLPTFFSRIWGRTSASVQATATAEAYNSGGAQTANASYVPSPKCVKPLLVANVDPVHSPTTPFVNTTDGSIPVPYNTYYNPSVLNKGGFIGEPITLKSGCPGPAGCGIVTTLAAGQYLPGTVPAGSSTSGSNGAYNSSVCPGDCTYLGGTPYQQSIACCDTTTYNFTQCSNSSNTYSYYDLSNNPDSSSQTYNGLQCVLHSSAGLPDTLTPPTLPSEPFQIQPGAYSQRVLNLGPTAYMSTSDSLITVPLISNPIGPGNQVTVVGFLQLFLVGATATPPTTITATVINVIGCGSAAASGYVSGGGVSPVPVRLITPP